MSCAFVSRSAMHSVKPEIRSRVDLRIIPSFEGTVMMRMHRPETGSPDFTAHDVVALTRDHLGRDLSAAFVTTSGADMINSAWLATQSCTINRLVFRSIAADVSEHGTQHDSAFSNVSRHYAHGGRVVWAYRTSDHRGFVEVDERYFLTFMCPYDLPDEKLHLVAFFLVAYVEITAIWPDTFSLIDALFEKRDTLTGDLRSAQLPLYPAAIGFSGSGEPSRGSRFLTRVRESITKWTYFTVDRSLPVSYDGDFLIINADEKPHRRQLVCGMTEDVLAARIAQITDVPVEPITDIVHMTTMKKLARRRLRTAQFGNDTYGILTLPDAYLLVHRAATNSWTNTNAYHERAMLISPKERLNMKKAAGILALVVVFGMPFSLAMCPEFPV